jgi:hypothetical protein
MCHAIGPNNDKTVFLYSVRHTGFMSLEEKLLFEIGSIAVTFWNIFLLRRDKIKSIFVDKSLILSSRFSMLSSLSLCSIAAERELFCCRRKKRRQFSASSQGYHLFFVFFMCGLFFFMCCPSFFMCLRHLEWLPNPQPEQYQWFDIWSCHATAFSPAKA